MPVTNYLWDEVNDTLLAETDDAGNTIAEYTHEPGQFGPLISQRRNGQTSYYQYDGQGSTRALTDEAGNGTDMATYTAFGEPVASSGTTANPFGYKGALGYYVNAEANDVYVRARVYQPATARWLSVDLIRFVPEDADQSWRDWLVVSLRRVNGMHGESSPHDDGTETATLDRHPPIGPADGVEPEARRRFLLSFSVTALHNFLKTYGLDRASRVAATTAAEPAAADPATSEQALIKVLGEPPTPGRPLPALPQDFFWPHPVHRGLPAAPPSAPLVGHRTTMLLG